MTDHFYVYALFRENGQPFYIGKGRGRRWLMHEKDARAGAKGHRSSIIRQMLARGIDVPKIKIHEGLTDQVALQYEIALIAAIGRQPHGPLLNLTAGGDGVSDPSQTTRAKMRERMLGRFLGKKLTPEHIARRSAAVTGSKRSPEARANLQRAAQLRGLKMLGQKQSLEHVAKRMANQRGRKASPEALAKMRGRKRTPESIAKTRAANLGRTRSPETREKMRQAALRRVATPEGRENMRQAGLRSAAKGGITNLYKKRRPLA